MNREEILNLIREQLQEYVPTFSNINVPPHTHNGSDSQQIPFKNVIIYPGDGSTPNIDTGIALVNGQDMYNIYVLDSGGIAPLVIQPNQHAFDGGGADLYFGLSTPFSGVVFNKIFLNANGAALSEEITCRVTDTVGGGTNSGFTSLTAGQFDIQTSDGIHFLQTDFFPQLINIQIGNPVDNFAIQMPRSTQPTPAKGMYSFDGANFKAVDGSTTFKYVPLSDATTTGGTVATGTIRVTINGVDYNLLHT